MKIRILKWLFHLGEEVWQAVIGVLHLIQLITDAVGDHHAISTLIKVNDF